jgi:prepilin-type N-terminal cleavage/methylation domain-containing protein
MKRQRRVEFQSAIHNPKSAMRPGFTLVELLVVIGIIVLLVGILMPVVRGVRISAFAADSRQQILRLTSAIEAYKADYGAYPGPLSNDQIIMQKDLPSPTTGSAVGALTNVTMSENLVLGIAGGLKPSTKTTGAAAPEYDEQRILSRMGPMGLNPLSPKSGHAYIDVAAAELSLDGSMQENPQSKKFNFKSNQGGPAAKDSAIPEFVDHFPDPLPVIYLRARTGAPGVMSQGNKPEPFQYDLNQFGGYTLPSTPVPAPGGGQGRWSTGIGGHPTAGGHGLQKLGTATLIQQVPSPSEPWGTGTPPAGAPPYQCLTYFMDPQLTNTKDASSSIAKQATPRQKDGYILISPGKDRIYGTRDDITNFGSL